MTIYHVTREWDGADLKPLASRLDDGEIGTLDDALALIAERWTDGDLRKAEEYLDGDGRAVHFHATLAEAVDFRDDWCDGGLILAVDADGLEVAEGSEYPHPVVYGIIPADLVSVVEMSRESDRSAKAMTCGATPMVEHDEEPYFRTLMSERREVVTSYRDYARTPWSQRSTKERARWTKVLSDWHLARVEYAELDPETQEKVRQVIWAVARPKGISEYAITLRNAIEAVTDLD